MFPVARNRFPAHRAVLAAVAAAAPSLAWAQTRVVGVDVSQFQLNMDWSKTYTAGARFAFVRSSRGGLTGSSDSGGTGNTVGQGRYDDPLFQTNMTDATVAGVLAGAYHFARTDLNSTSVPEDEANHFLQQASDRMTAGYLRPVMDIESFWPGLQFSQFPAFRSYLADWIPRFSNTIEAATGVKPIIYSYNSFITDFLTTQTEYSLWSSTVSCNFAAGTPVTGAWAGDWAFWQHGQAKPNAANNACPAITQNAGDFGVEIDLSTGLAKNSIDLNVANGDIEYVKKFKVPSIWLHPIDSNWDTVGNWNGRKPLATDDVVVRSPTLGTGGTIALGSGEVGQSLLFNESYTLSGGSITLSAGNISVAAGKTATLATNLSGIGGFTKTGDGKLVISANTTNTGTRTITAGTLSIDNRTRLAPGGKVVLNGGILQETNASNAGTFIEPTTPIEVGPAGGAVNYTSSGAGLSSIYAGTLTGTGGTTANGGAGTLTKTGPGEFRYQGAGTANSTFQNLIVKEGLFRLGNVFGANFETGFGAVPTATLAGAITLDGGAIGSSWNVTLNGKRGITITPAGGTIDVSSGSITIPSKISGSNPLTVVGTTGVATLGNTGNEIGSLIVNGRVAMSTAQTVGSLSGNASGAISIGSVQILTINQTVDGTYAGSIVNDFSTLEKRGPGVLTLTGNTTIHSLTLNDGTLRLTGGIFHGSGVEYLAYTGSATFVQTGGTHTMDGALNPIYIGLNPDAAGTYRLSGGSLSVTSDIYCGYNGPGLIEQTGGAVSMSPSYSLALGYFQLGAGIYSLSGTGSVSVPSVYLGGSAAGANGTGIMAISGGTFTITDTLKIYNSGSSAVNLSGGTLNVGTLVTSPSPSRVNWTGGKLAVTGASGFAVENTAPLANFTIGAGMSLAVTGGTETVGNLGVGTLTQTGGENGVGSINASRTLVIGASAAGSGRYNLSGGNLIVTGNAYVGGTSGAAGGNGVLSITGGNAVVTGTLKVWNPTGMVSLAGGSLSVGTLDNNGHPERFSWTSGTLGITASDLIITNAGPLGGIVSLGPAQSLSVTLNENVGTSAGGTLAQTGGTNSIGGTLIVANSVSSFGLYQLQNGIVEASSLIVGRSGSGTFVQSGGTFTKTGAMTIGANNGSSGVYILSGGVLNDPTIIVGGAGTTGTATFSQTGASTNNVGSFIINSNGRYTLSGGVLNAGSITAQGPLEIAGSGAILNLSGALSGSGTTSVGAGASLIAGSARQSNLTIGGRVTITARTGGAPSVSYLDALNVQAEGTLDLNDNDLVVNNGNFNMLQALVLGGYRVEPDSSATGIVSTTSQSIHAGTTILALFDNALAGFADYPFGSGNSIATGAIAGKYTYIGDTNYDGQVSAQDYTAIDANIGTSVDPGISWFYGDTNFDGNIDAALGLGQGNPLAIHALAAVPEPTLALVPIACLLLRRRRKHPRCFRLFVPSRR